MNDRKTGTFSIEETVRDIRPPDTAARQAALKKQQALLKPMGSLGEMEEIALRIAGITGRTDPVTERKIHFLFGADNGVYEEGVSGTPQSFTRLLMEVYADGRGGCIDTLCRKAGADLRVYDLGVKGMTAAKGVDSSHKLMPEGTYNLRTGRAMPLDIARRAVETGIELVRQAAEEGYQIIGIGEVGMANTTTATACIMACTQNVDDALIGRGGGLTDAAFARKREVIRDALAQHHLGEGHADPLEILSCVGGLDIAAMCGVYLGAAACRLPVIIDGVISIAAALLAEMFAPGAKAYMFASHNSKEPAYAAAAEALQVRPVLDLEMRLGEGSGCPITMQIIDDALYLMNHMATFEDVSMQTEYREELKF